MLEIFGLLRKGLLRVFLFGMGDRASLATGFYNSLNTSQKKELWKSHPIRGHIEVRVPGLPAILMKSKNDDTVIQELFWTGFQGWEFFSLRVWASLAKGLQADSVVLDIGCYTGIYSLILKGSSPSTRVISCDFQRKCAVRAKENLLINDFDAEVEEIAVIGDDRTVISGFHNPNQESLSSVAGLTPNNYNPNSISVRAVTVDNLCIEKKIPLTNVRLIKIDVEGAELGVLEGMSGVLEGGPDILLEINSGKRLAEVLGRLPADYKLFMVEDTGGGGRLHRIRRNDVRMRGRNFLATKRPQGEIWLIQEQIRDSQRINSSLNN